MTAGRTQAKEKVLHSCLPSVIREKFKILRAGRRRRIILEPIPLVIGTAEDHVNKLIGPTLDPAALNMTRHGVVNDPTSTVSGSETGDRNHRYGPP